MGIGHQLSIETMPYFWLKMAAAITVQNYKSVGLGLIQRTELGSCVAIWLWTGSLSYEDVKFDAQIDNNKHLFHGHELLSRPGVDCALRQSGS